MYSSKRFTVSWRHETLISLSRPFPFTTIRFAERPETAGCVKRLIWYTDNTSEGTLRTLAVAFSVSGLKWHKRTMYQQYSTRTVLNFFTPHGEELWLRIERNRRLALRCKTFPPDIFLSRNWKPMTFPLPHPVSIDVKWKYPFFPSWLHVTMYTSTTANRLPAFNKKNTSTMCSGAQNNSCCWVGPTWEV